MKNYILPLLVLSFLSRVAVGAPGQIEINQTSVEASGGFPYSINQPGSYVLTSDLVVPTSVSAIVVNVVGDVAIDLNGFGIRGSGGCFPSACNQGGTNGIRGLLTQTAGMNVSIHDGEISSFSGDCVALGAGAHLERLRVFGCGFSGIRTSDGSSVVMGNTVFNTGREGMNLGVGTAYGHNSVSFTNLGTGGGGDAVQGGTAISGNYCDDQSCSPSGSFSSRRFYLSTEPVDGSRPLEACAKGFHFASLFEIHDLASLEYDTTRGVTTADSGAGPPSNRIGWVRTGGDSNQSISAGVGNCSAWTSSSVEGFGTIVFLARSWTNPGTEISPYVAQGALCAGDAGVWCIQD